MDDKHKLTSQNLNQLVKLWMNGSSKLEFVEIGVNRSINFQEVLTDIEKEPVKWAYIENIPEDFEQGHAFKIRQENGKEAVLCLSMDMYFVMTTHFEERDCDFLSEYESLDEDDGGDEEDRAGGEIEKDDL